MQNSPASSVTKPIEPGAWGRRTTASMHNSVGAALMVIICPIWAFFNWITLEHFQGSLNSTLAAVVSITDRSGSLRHFPRPSWTSVVGYAGWLLLQALLYRLLPGKTCTGQRTPAGHLLRYKTNGLMAWTVTHVLFAFAVYQGWLDPAFIAKNWQGLLIVTNIYGFVLAGLAQVKGYWMPSYPDDRKLSGSLIYDFWAGVELNPQLGKSWDLKFFHNGRPGIVAWTLIDISFAAYQFESYGYVSTSMLVVIALHALYVLDFFANEDWYVRTIDITHEHFGFMLAWGDIVFLPSFYTLQAQFLARHPAELSTLQAALILGVGLLAYSVFRSANRQKHRVRALNGKAIIWFFPASFLRCAYRTKDGKQHDSILLTSGWWGMCRHANYTADLFLSWAMCAPCCWYTQSLLPWSYFIYMCVLLNNRMRRDERRCRAKYKETWEEYCRVVPWRLIPWIY